jgi:hypothetical protein
MWGRGARKREIDVLALQVLNCRKREDGNPFILDYFLDFLRILKASGQYYGGEFFSMILFIFFM